MTPRRAFLATIVPLALVLVGAIFVPRPAIAPVEVPAPSSFEPASVARGRELAHLGFCASCHTAVRGQPYAGGRQLDTGFGTIYGTNITPDPATGIGRWSLAAFSRAMREGIDRRGARLYPAFPYTHFTKLSDEDIQALYAFVMTREPVRADTPPNRLRFPYSLRPLLAAWNLLFFREGRFAPDSAESPEWNHGAYLAEALSHCGACHSPRNALGAEIASHTYGGGEADGWWAPPLGRDTLAPVPWTAEGLFNYLRSWDVDHGGGAGPMAPVVSDLAAVHADDVRAIAAYLASLAGPLSADRAYSADAAIARADAAATAHASAPGAALYAGACAVCHDSGGSVPFTLRSLALHSAVRGPAPRNVIQAVMYGIDPPSEAVGGIMPPFADVLTDRQVADVVAYVRARFGDAPPWANIEGDVRALRAAQ